MTPLDRLWLTPTFLRLCFFTECDVSTCWNSTYNMLLFAYNFHPAIDSMTGQHDFDLQKYKLSSAEWGIAKELRDVLKVFLSPSSFASCLLSDLWPDFQRHNVVFFLMAPQTLPQSSWQWIILTKSLPPPLTDLSILSQFVQLSLLCFNLDFP